MGKKRKTKRFPEKPKSCYPLRQVGEKLSTNMVRIRGNALSSALKDFGWESADIIDALKKLTPDHYDKTDPSEKKPGIMLDFYRAANIKGENIYTHFYIDDQTGFLIINSFKEWS